MTNNEYNLSQPQNRLALVSAFMKQSQDKNLPELVDSSWHQNSRSFKWPFCMETYLSFPWPGWKIGLRTVRQALFVGKGLIPVTWNNYYVIHWPIFLDMRLIAITTCANAKRSIICKANCKRNSCHGIFGRTSELLDAGCMLEVLVCKDLCQ